MNIYKIEDIFPSLGEYTVLSTPIQPPKKGVIIGSVPISYRSEVLRESIIQDSFRTLSKATNNHSCLSDDGSVATPVLYNRLSIASKKSGGKGITLLPVDVEAHLGVSSGKYYSTDLEEVLDTDSDSPSCHSILPDGMINFIRGIALPEIEETGGTNE